MTKHDVTIHVRGDMKHDIEDDMLVHVTIDVIKHGTKDEVC